MHVICMHGEALGDTPAPNIPVVLMYAPAYNTINYMHIMHTYFMGNTVIHM